MAPAPAAVASIAARAALAIWTFAAVPWFSHPELWRCDGLSHLEGVGAQRGFGIKQAD